VTIIIVKIRTCIKIMLPTVKIQFFMDSLFLYGPLTSEQRAFLESKWNQKLEIVYPSGDNLESSRALKIKPSSPHVDHLLYIMGQ